MVASLVRTRNNSHKTDGRAIALLDGCLNSSSRPRALRLLTTIRVQKQRRQYDFEKRVVALSLSRKPAASCCMCPMQLQSNNLYPICIKVDREFWSGSYFCPHRGIWRLHSRGEATACEPARGIAPDSRA